MITHCPSLPSSPSSPNHLLRWPCEGGPILRMGRQGAQSPPPDDPRVPCNVSQPYVKGDPNERFAKNQFIWGPSYRVNFGTCIWNFNSEFIFRHFEEFWERNHEKKFATFFLLCFASFSRLILYRSVTLHKPIINYPVRVRVRGGTYNPNWIFLYVTIWGFIVNFPSYQRYNMKLMYELRRITHANQKYFYIENQPIIEKSIIENQKNFSTYKFNCQFCIKIIIKQSDDHF